MAIELILTAQKRLNDPPAAILLGALVYRFAIAKHKRKGKAYAVNSRAQIMEYTGLSRHQYDRALSVLQKMGLIEVEIHKSKYHGGHVSTFEHVPKETKALLKKEPMSDAADAQMSVEEDGQNSAQSDIPIIIKQEVLQEGQNAAATDDGCASLEWTLEEGKEEESRCEENWRSAHTKAYPSVYIGRWEKPQKAFLRHLVKKIAPHSLEKLLPEVVLNWEDYRGYVLEYACWKKTSVPQNPDLLFLLKTSTQLVNFFLRQQREERKEQEREEERKEYEREREQRERQRRAEEERKRRAFESEYACEKFIGRGEGPRKSSSYLLEKECSVAEAEEQCQDVEQDGEVL